MNKFKNTQELKDFVNELSDYERVAALESICKKMLEEKQLYHNFKLDCGVSLVSTQTFDNINSENELKIKNHGF